MQKYGCKNKNKNIYEKMFSNDKMTSINSKQNTFYKKITK